MKTIKVSEASGAALDWLVAKCMEDDLHWEGFRPFAWHHERDERVPFHPSTDWAQGGPIIERANITIIRADDDCEVDAQGFATNKRIPQWFAECDRWTGHSRTTSYEGEHMEPTFMIGEAGGYYGPTLLIAAMRCYVASKMGDTVEVPEELL